MILVITGSRDADKEMCRHLLEEFVKDKWYGLEIWHGGCFTGADRAAAEYAATFPAATTCTSFPADWATYGSSAGPRRNKAMMQAAARKQTLQGGCHLVEVIAFPCATADNKGTLNAIYEAIGAKLDLTIKWV